MPVSKAPSGSRDVIPVRDFSRSEPFRIFGSIARMWKIVRNFRPDVVLTTGAAPGLVALAVGKLYGAQTIWLESIANAEKLSMSGQIAGKFVDLWLTQWPDLAKRHGGLEYYGQVL